MSNSRMFGTDMTLQSNKALWDAADDMLVDFTAGQSMKQTRRGRLLHQPWQIEIFRLHEHPCDGNLD